jgi:hypothetical protein
MEGSLFKEYLYNMKILLTEDQYKQLRVNEGGKGPTIRLYNRDEFDESDISALKKMKTVYKALSTGKSSVQIGNSNFIPLMDISYELPPINETLFIIEHPDHGDERYSDVTYKILTPSKSINFNLLNYDEIEKMDLVLPISPREVIIEKYYSELTQPIRQRFKKFNIKFNSF